jgi:LysR family hydrogen peroxide-inducible transcriptional activator
MNIQQLEYIIAVDTYRHFSTAAEKCFITQPTLSMMIHKLEEELDVKIFDRSKQPVTPTDIGVEIIEQAKKVIMETKRMGELVQEWKGEIKGELRLGVIPTIAPYLLPLFLGELTRSYPNLRIKISELTTASIIAKLEKQQLDAGILATPLSNAAIKTIPLFYERFFIYTSPLYPASPSKLFKMSEINTDKLWLLEEGHCLRSQVLNLCDLKKPDNQSFNIDYEAGSIETLKRMVEINEGVTIVPELALDIFTPEQKKNLRYFEPPVPGREIGIVTYRHFVKEKLISALKNQILAKIPDEMKNPERLSVTRID